MKIYNEIKNTINYYGYDDSDFTYEFYKAYIAYIHYRQILHDSDIYGYDSAIEYPLHCYDFFKPDSRVYRIFLDRICHYSMNELIHSI